MATAHPPSASRTATARPMPRDPPVTSADLPSKSLAMRASGENARGIPVARAGRLAIRARAVMRVGIIGLGAIGGVLATRLVASRRKGEEIVLAAGRSTQAIREHGLRIDGEQPVLPPSVAERLDGAPYDVILLCTRTDDIETALLPAASLLDSGGTVVCVQNGLPEERAARIVGEDRLLGAVIGWSANATGPGEYRITGGGKFTLGAVSARSEPRVMTVAGLLERAFPVKRTTNLQGARWSKLAMNCALSTLGAVSGLDFGGLAANRDARELAVIAVREAVRGGPAEHRPLEPGAGVGPSLGGRRRP